MLFLLVFFKVYLIFLAYLLSPTCEFNVIPLGVHGGHMEGNLTSFLIARNTSTSYVALDAGTIFQGLKEFVSKSFLGAQSVHQLDFKIQNSITNDQIAASIMKEHIHAYFLGHSHLDHVSGLILNSPLMSNITKKIVGFDFVVDAINQFIFRSEIWVPLKYLSNYQISSVKNTQEYSMTQFVNDGSMSDVTMKAFELCHDSLNSTAFLMTARMEGNITSQVLYFSDTGPSNTSTCDWRGKINQIWKDPLLSNLSTLKFFILYLTLLEQCLSKFHSWMQ
jgi:3',5'-cyclic-nucleotide phosphodiesterase